MDGNEEGQDKRQFFPQIFRIRADKYTNFGGTVC